MHNALTAPGARLRNEAHVPETEEGRVEMVVWTPDPSGLAQPEGSGVQTIETEEGRRGGSGHEQEPSPNLESLSQ